MQTNLLARAFRAGAPVQQFRVVKLNESGNVVQSGAATDPHIGVCIQPSGAAAGDVCDVQMVGIVDAVAGGTIVPGALVTADADGRVVTATATAGTNVRIIGIALKGAASGDIFPVFLTPGSYQG